MRRSPPGAFGTPPKAAEAQATRAAPHPADRQQAAQDPLGIKAGGGQSRGCPKSQLGAHQKSPDTRAVLTHH